MKVLKSSHINPFGGLNFVLDYLSTSGIDKLLNANLPNLVCQSRYSWSDIFYSILSIYLCCGDCVKDIQNSLKDHFKNNPYIKMPSSDTVLRRMNDLSEPSFKYKTKRGSIDHSYSTNSILKQLNLRIFGIIGTILDSISDASCVYISDNSDLKTTHFLSFTRYL